MGWFRKKINQANILGVEAGQLAKSQIHQEFSLNNLQDNEVFNPPSGFFKDPYIVGFVHGYIATMADVGSAKRGKRWNEQEAREFMLSAMEEVVGPQELKSFIGEPRRCQNIKEYKEAYFSANTLIKAIFSPLGLTDENPLVREANKVVEERKQFLLEMFPNLRKGEILAWGIKEISISRHIQAVYLQ